ncbi:hypothetical protein B0H66DRAFT_577506 [Apodospora peruviana]|uniref:S-adenosylmethionine-dependent methyltransferase-like protein n=1 Tax=Apodospora peruviana TaxID=516989 RepID=A0AAE0HWZ4_9PEZI|nr:hypothetical protein B0H66DRAFT_577506 [Apodospora peruviana]
MPFYRAGKTNRSQHNLVGTTVAEGDPSASGSASVSAPLSSGPSAAASPSSAGGASVGAAGNPSSALPNPAFSSNESFQVSGDGTSNHPQPPQPPPHLSNLYNSPAGGRNPAFSQLQHSNTVTGSIDSRQRDPDFADQVTRSQSHRYTQISPTLGHHQQPQVQQQQQQQISPKQQQQQQHQQLSPQHQQQQAFGASSVEDLPGTASPNFSPPLVGQSQQFVGQPLQQQQQQQLPPPKAKQSTRKLIKNILSGNSSSRSFESHHHHHSQNSYANQSGLDRRSSKRVSQPPPIRTGVSQISLEQPPDWQNQAPLSQPSPLQGIGEFRDSYIVNPDQELHLQNPHDTQHPTIRPVHPTDSESSPYSADEIGYHQHQSHIQQQGHIPPEPQHQQYGGQVVFDPSQQQYHILNTQQVQYQGGNQPVISGHLGNPQQQNPETVSQLSRESPVTDSDQRSATNVQPSQASPAASYTLQTQDLPVHQNPPSAQPQTPQQQQQQAMPPPAGGPPPPRRSQETEKAQPPGGPPPSYRQSQQPSMNPLPQPPSAVGQNPNYPRVAGRDGPQYDGPGDIQGRNSPQPSASDRGGEDPEKAFKELLTKYKNVKRLYFDGKKEIEQLSSQVEQLQNAIANQRMSQSRTSLDDSEYSTRFNRLNGAITNLSFNIRKDWVTLPSWLVPYVSADAIKTGKQEMTAVGRAVITRWVVEEIFNRCFHPGLEPELSKQLKTIEQNIRHFSYTMNSQEEFDALTSKVVNWRMATLEGLQDVLRSGESANHKADFTRRATTNLTACLFQHLTDPPPPGVDGSASMIVELAVSIAANLPLESRDVAIVYPLPEQQIAPEIMEVEKQGLPALESRPSDASEESVAGEEGASSKENAKDRRGDKAKTGMLNTILGSSSSSTVGSSDNTGRKGSIADASSSHSTGAASGPVPPPKDPAKVRFAGFVGVEVRGRHILVKAPVWTLA